ncbi:MAG: hypothetical protein ACC628_20295 [Pirellulaceae bacterium]
MLENSADEHRLGDRREGAHWWQGLVVDNKVMVETRNDLIKTPEAQRDMAGMLARWLSDALAGLNVELPVAEPMALTVKEARCRSSS